MVGWILVVILFIMSIFLILGKGGWLLAGYNTASPQEKSKYDEKKLCRGAGVMLLIVTIATAIIMMMKDDRFAIYYILIVAFSVIVYGVYANKKCFKK